MGQEIRLGVTNMEEKYNFDKLTEMQIKLIACARENVISELKTIKDKNFTIKNDRGMGIKRYPIDRRMHQWISTNYKDIEYCINFFYSEIDYKSGNIHTQMGRIMFTKGYRYNKSKVSSPNEILKDYKGRYMSDENKTVLIFSSETWINPVDYFEKDDKSNKKMITVDDINNDDDILKKLVKAFMKFVKCEFNNTQNK